MGRRCLLIGLVWAVALALVFVLTAPCSSTAGFGFFVPISVVFGSSGRLMTFSSDRSRGVFEYLMSYGVLPRVLFKNGLVASAALAGILVVLAFGVGLGAADVRGIVLTGSGWQILALYTVPMSLACALFATTAGMVWLHVSSPGSWVDNPFGSSPLVGIAPQFVVAISAALVPTSEVCFVFVGAAS